MFLLHFSILFVKINKVKQPIGGEIMANIKSAKKRILVTERQSEENVPIKSRMKTAIKKAIENPTVENVNEANKRIDKAVSKNIITKNKAAREKSRVNSKLNK